MPDYRDALRNIRSFPSLVRFLRDELDWPISSDDFEELTFDYTPEELGIDAANAAKIQEIKRLRPLSVTQPWGIFFVKFEPKQLPVVTLRRILSRVVMKKRASANSADRAAWQMNDLLFISNYGEGEERRISLAHFSQDNRKDDLPTLKVLGWDNLNTPLHLDHVAEKLSECLFWPEDEEDTEQWRENWQSAFTLKHKEVITTSQALAVRLADLAKAIRDRINTVLAIESEDGAVTKLMQAFKEALVHDLDEDGFADMYAQTIAYGLLSARIEHPEGRTADDFSMQMPVTNPFLKELLETFLHVGGRKKKADDNTGLDFDELGVGDVVELLDRSNMEAVVSDFGDRNPQEDPVIHFYEMFLKEYDAAQKVSRGVFYTPRPVVSFIVRSVDELLRSDFGLDDGLADTTTWGEMAGRVKDLTIPKGSSQDQAFLQILDPATGTGTFLVEIIDCIHKTLVTKWKTQGHDGKKVKKLWNEYVPKHLLPRLHGYELLMAPFAIAHMKIGLKLYETGYRFGGNERAQIYLTDSLEPGINDNKQMIFNSFSPALAHEAKTVNTIKSERNFTIIIGNPPYLREKERGPGERKERIGGWIRFGDKSGEASPLFDDFLEPLSKVGKGVHAKLAYELSIMFWRLVLWLTFERSPGPGIVGMISPRALLSGPGHYGMRWFLRKSVGDIWITDLGGDNRGARKSENVFDIETGVAISICSNAPGASVSDICNVRYSELIGTSEEKLGALQEITVPSDMNWKNCQPEGDVFIPSNSGPYTKWPRLTNLFPWQHSGCQFKRLWPIAESKEVLQDRWKLLVSMPREERAAAFIETDARLVKGGKALRFTGIIDEPRDAATPTIQRYSYRNLDRQWALIDERFADRLRPDLISTMSDEQLFVITMDKVIFLFVVPS